MPTILFIILPYPSHYLASFGFAKMWQERAYKIVFTGFENHRDLVEKEGFEFEPLYYGHITYIKTIKGFLGLWLRSAFDKNDTKKRYQAYYARGQAVQAVVEQHQPRLVFLDEHLCDIALYLAEYKQTFVMLNTKLSTKKRAGTPPLNSAFCPNASIWSWVWCEWLWAKHIAWRNYESFIENLTFNGMGELGFQARITKKLGLDTKKMFSQQNAIYAGVRAVPTVVLAPACLEIAPPNADETVFYCNPPIVRDESAYMTEDYKNLRDDLQQKQQQGTKIILAAFGTISSMKAEKMKTFLEKLVAAIVKKPNWHLVLATTGINAQLPTVANLSILDFVPQMDALTWIDAMITHGGLTTIKECMQAQVPMLIYPYNYKADAPSNGARVTQKAWGLNGTMGEDGATIAQKLSRVIDLKLPPPKPDLDLPAGLLTLLHQQKDLQIKNK